MNLSNKKIVFIAGLHRSGTSVLHEVLGTQYGISKFSNTGVPEDEGQHLQSVMKPAYYYGGPGSFGFNPDAYLDDCSPLNSAHNQEILIGEWSKYWDLSKSILVEKSPPNLIRCLFLQSIFEPASTYFIALTRHPIVVAIATKKWVPALTIERLIEHWIVCHKILYADKHKIRNLIVIRYEDMVKQNTGVIEQISDFLDFPLTYTNQFNDYNRSYLKSWSLISKEYDLSKYEADVNTFGYSLEFGSCFGH